MNGILLVDKPEGWTSNDVVCKLKGVLHERRIGHTGTLDPMATGLLPVFIGKATKAVEFAENDRKRYIAGITFGVVTDTQDITGNVLSECSCSITHEEFLNVIKQFHGDTTQIPPMFSALKYRGKRLYELARQGIEVERKPRAVTIFDITLITKQDNGYLFSVTCSAGTYVRTLCHDIGQILGCGACMSSLRRVECGPFSIEDSFTLSQIQEKAAESSAEELLLAVESLFNDFPVYICTDSEERLVKNGRPFSAALADGKYRVMSPSGEFLMLAESESNSISSIKNFFEVS